MKFKRTVHNAETHISFICKGCLTKNTLLKRKDESYECKYCGRKPRNV